uniref:Uncharacterized protein n=1 Tax=Arundo donax TaxID=35708 RepID=A0A0A9FRX0_ARUDO
MFSSLTQDSKLDLAPKKKNLRFRPRRIVVRLQFESLFF